MKKLGISLLALIGIGDSIYLTWQHFDQRIVPCTVDSWSDCNRVLESEYAFLFGVPLAVWGLLHYTLLLFNESVAQRNKRPSVRQVFAYVVLVQTAVGLVMSIYFVYLQLGVIQAICKFCMVSAILSVILFFVARYVHWQHCRRILFSLIGGMYQWIMKPVLFVIDPETIHEQAMRQGELFGTIAPIRWLLRGLLYYLPEERFAQTIKGIRFPGVIGLSAGYDYEARLTQVLAPIGFGFQSVGTITNRAYQGNTKPRLGRLPKSQSLLVNKGFKNEGAQAIVERLSGLSFPIPVGISIGVTNSKEISTIDQGINDILEAFQTVSASSVNHAYYELNISCPNLHTRISFQDPTNFELLVRQIAKLQLDKPVFVKMPINITDDEARDLLDRAAANAMDGVIFGNLQKDRQDLSFAPEEISEWENKKGNFSGKPTWHRSNQLIRLAYQQYRSRLVIIGCGGIFSAEDAYEKICNGASLLQLISGMIFQGPQLISQINLGVEELLARDGFSHISEAVGSRVTE